MVRARTITARSPAAVSNRRRDQHAPRRGQRAVVAALAIAAGTPALGQSNVATTNKFAWSENCGWLNFRDAGSPVSAQGARFIGSFASGFVWGENIGWINLGDGTPSNGVSYANVDGNDFGVNINTGTGALTGLAWGENVGWINFSGGALATPAQPARIDQVAKRLRGYAWGENIGWINLDDVNAFVGIRCPADFNGVGGVTVQDIFDYLEAWFANNPLANFNGVDGVTVQDIFDFLTAWFGGC